MAEPNVAPAAPVPAPPAAPPAAAPASSGNTLSDIAYDRLSPNEQSRYSRMKVSPDAGSGSEWRLRSDLSGTPPAAPGTAPAPDAPASVVDGKLVVGEGENRMELSGQDVREIMRAKAEADMRATRVPPTAAEYRAELPKDLRLPPGIEIRIDPNDAAFKDLQALAHSRGWSRDDFAAALGIFAAREARDAAHMQTLLKAEIAKLGPNGSQRISAINTFLRGLVGDEHAKPLASMLVSERHVVALEHLADKYMSGGAASFSQSHREPAAGNGKVSDEDYAKMSAAQKWAYARSFSNSSK
jgi:hypothetical protein